MKSILIPLLFSFGLCNAQNSKNDFHADFAIVADTFEKEWLIYTEQAAKKQYKPLEETADRATQLVRNEQVRTAVRRQQVYVGEIRKLVGDALWRLKTHVDYTSEKKGKIFDSFEEHYRLAFIYLDYEFFDSLRKKVLLKPEQKVEN